VERAEEQVVFYGNRVVIGGERGLFRPVIRPAFFLPRLGCHLQSRHVSYRILNQIQSAHLAQVHISQSDLLMRLKVVTGNLLAMGSDLSSSYLRRMSGSKP
jgi:hypothetical protein